MNAYTKLARETLAQYLSNNTLPKIDKQSPELLNSRAGCFVTIHLKKDDNLRGCIGTIAPVYKNLAGEIIANSIEAGLHDPRFEPMTLKELDQIKITVDILSSPILIPDIKDQDPKKDGVIVETADGRSGILLPDIDGVDSAESQLDIAKSKAAILKDEEVLLYKFSVQRWEED